MSNAGNMRDFDELSRSTTPMKDFGLSSTALNFNEQEVLEILVKAR
jgi:hypothetical protein